MPFCPGVRLPIRVTPLAPRTKHGVALPRQQQKRQHICFHKRASIRCPYVMILPGMRLKAPVITRVSSIGMMIVVVVLGRRMLGGEKPRGFPARHELLTLILREHERNNAAHSSISQQTTHVSTNEYRLTAVGKPVLGRKVSRPWRHRQDMGR